jgi:hypothetical protein
MVQKSVSMASKKSKLFQLGPFLPQKRGFEPNTMKLVKQLGGFSAEWPCPENSRLNEFLLMGVSE